MADEQGTFIFAITFIIIFSALISSIPIGLNGQGATPEEINPLNPSFSTGYTEINNWNGSVDYTEYTLYWIYGSYSLGGKDWFSYENKGTSDFEIGSKALIGGFLWLGTLYYCNFITNDGTNLGDHLSFTEIEEYASNGEASFSLVYKVNGQSGGDFIIWWNTTDYTDPSDAWDNEVLYLAHGMGLEDTAVKNVGLLLIQLLTLTIPEVPVLLGFFIAAPLYASIIFLIWFLLKETTPFLG